jgi:hypothetical protein
MPPETTLTMAGIGDFLKSDHVLTNSGVLGLQPVATSPALVEAALSLRHDAFEAELAGFGEHDCAVGGERVAKQDPADAGDEPLDCLPTLFDRALYPRG